MSAYVLPVDITPSSAERIYARAKADAAAQLPDERRCLRGFRIARSRDPIFLAACERYAEVMEQLCERQLGEQLRAGKTEVQRTRPPEVQMAVEAYRMADRGTPELGFGYLYLAIAEHEGIYSY